METQTYESELDRLAALQDVDRRIKEKQEQATTLTAEAEDWTARLAQLRDEVARLNAERDRLETERAQLESRLESESQRVKESRMRMNRARNEREMLALKHEVNVAREGNQALEDQILTIMERVEAIGGQLAVETENLARLESAAEQEIATRRSRVEELRQEVEGEKRLREAVTTGMSRELRNMYEQIFSRRGGTAVALVKNGTCQGCYVSLPPQLHNELQKHRDVRQCPNCHRILYWKPEEK